MTNDPAEGQPTDAESAAMHPAEDPSTGRLVATAAASAGVSLIAWLLPVIVLGGLGLLLVERGSTETVNAIGMEETELAASAIFGYALVCFAVAILFGRRRFGAIILVAKGEAGFSDIFAVRDNLISLAISVCAVFLGFACIFWAITA